MNTSRLVVPAIRLTLLVALLLAWEFLPRAGIVDPELVPPFTHVAHTLAALLSRTSVQTDLATTGLEIVASFAIAVPTGAALGLVIAESRYLSRVFDPLLFFLFGIPKSIFLPMFILTLGIGFWQKVGFGCFSATLLVLLSTQAAVRSVRADHVLTARSYGATPWQIVTHVYLPGMLPILLEAMRIALIFTFTAVVLAEMYASQNGIGHDVATWGQNFMMPQLMAGVVLLALAAIVLNETIRRVEGKCGAWRT